MRSSVGLSTDLASEVVDSCEAFGDGDIPSCRIESRSLETFNLFTNLYRWQELDGQMRRWCGRRLPTSGCLLNRSIKFSLVTHGAREDIVMQSAVISNYEKSLQCSVQRWREC